MFDFLQGKKLNIVSVAYIVVVVGKYAGVIPAPIADAVENILIGLGGLAVRSAIKKAELL